MKILKNINNITVLILFHQFAVGQIKKNEFCNNYIENQEIEFHSNSMEKSFLQQNKIDSNLVNIIICTEGQLKRILHIELLDSVVHFAEYQYRNKLFVQINNKSITYSANKNISEIAGYYQYYFCNSLTHTYSKELILYVKGIQELRIMYEGAVYSNESLPETEQIKEIVRLINLYP